MSTRRRIFSIFFFVVVVVVGCCSCVLHAHIIPTLHTHIHNGQPERDGRVYKKNSEKKNQEKGEEKRNFFHSLFSVLVGGCPTSQ